MTRCRTLHDARLTSMCPHFRMGPPVELPLPFACCGAALTSTCRALASSLNASAAVWGQLELDVRWGRGRAQGQKRRCLLRSAQAHTEHVELMAAWLARRRGALRFLELKLLAAPDPQRLLPALAGSPALSALRLHCAASSACVLRPLPPLPALLSLSLASSPRGAAVIDTHGLATATPMLSRLEVDTGRGEGLRGPPAELPPALRALCLRGTLTTQVEPLLQYCGSRLEELQLQNISVGVSPPRFAAAMLAVMTALTKLVLQHCRVRAGGLACTLRTLRCLLALDLRGALGPKEGPSPALAAIGEACAGSLTQLSLAEWRLGVVPGELLSLAALQDLELGANPGLGEAQWVLGAADPTLFGPLGALTGLTRLGLGRCQLRELPGELQVLGLRLRCLVLCNNPLGLWRPCRPGAAAGLMLGRPLLSLQALEEIDLDNCSLAQLPVELGALPRLKRVLVAQNFLGDDAEDALPPSVEVLGLENQDDAGDPDFE